MSDPKCYLCDKPGKFESLFRSCKHESACFDCLRHHFVLQAKDVCKYPLECFHPECNLRLRNTQIERFVRKDQELQDYYDLTAKAKMNSVRLGDNWKEILEILREALGSIEIIRCPKCQMLITKNGGCDHMTCICGTEFNWCQTVAYHLARNRILRSAVEDPTITPSKKKKSAPFLQVDDDLSLAGRGSDSDPDESFDLSAEDTFVPYVAEETATIEYNPNDDLTTDDLESIPSDLDSILSTSLEKSAVSFMAAADTESWEQDFEVLELASDQSNDSWKQFEDAAASSVTITDCFQTSSNSNTTWEELSEVSSVVSFHSKTGMTFLEAARAASNQPSSQNRWKEVSGTPKPMSQLATIAERRTLMVGTSDDDDSEIEMYDADFMVAGAKCSRGGKHRSNARMRQG
ncbi:MAG: hypothetical protein SGBAC_007947 [Bacillariaceae sp.]